jgi:hypothetical protein
MLERKGPLTLFCLCPDGIYFIYEGGTARGRGPGPLSSFLLKLSYCVGGPVGKVGAGGGMDELRKFSAGIDAGVGVPEEADMGAGGLLLLAPFGFIMMLEG